MKRFIVLFSILLGTCVAVVHAERPNIVLILADDLGYADLACYGHPRVKTPHIDQLARDGVRFTQHYANGPECSPTRTALLTGRYQQYAGGLECAIGTGNVGRYDDAIRLANDRDLGLPAEQVVVPRALGEVGYRCGIFGKWHLGYEPKFNPAEHGWDAFFGYLGGNVHYFNHRETSDLHVLFDGNMPVYREGYMTKLITDESVRFIKEQTEPFFLLVSHESPHFPFQGPTDQGKLVTAENWMEIDSDAYVAMIEDLDNEVGRILKTIDDKGIRENTLVIFVSDNGGFAGAANMGPLRGSKSMTFEGGIRVPLIVRWPAKIPAGKDCDQVSLTFDLTRSIAMIAEADVRNKSLDGYDIIGHLVNETPEFDRTVFWRGKRGERVWRAVRDGDLKLVEKSEGKKTEQWLFDLANDIGETRDLKQRQPEQAQRLSRKLREWESKVTPQR